MNVPALIWLVVLLPLLGIGASFLAETPRRSAQACITFSGLGAALAVVVLVYRLNHNGVPYESVITFWCRSCASGAAASKIDDLHLQIGLMLDALSAVFLVLVTFAGLLVQVYASGYLRGEWGYRSLQWQTSLVTFASAGVVASSNLFTLLLMWGVGGVAAYLLTAYWTDRAAVGHAARRVFLAGRGAELALLLGIAIVYMKFAAAIGERLPLIGDNLTDPLSFQNLAPEFSAAVRGAVLDAGSHTVVVLGLLLLVAAALRSGLVPLHSWVLGTDQAPTPLTGYIQAAGAALGGVFLLLRMFQVYTAGPHLLDVLVLVGAVTAVGGALLALLQADIVRLLIYGGISQLGMVVLALSAGAYGAATQYLAVRGLVLLALFLAAANLMTAFRSRSLADMGAAAQRLPTTSRALFVVVLTAAAVAPLSGFWVLRSVLGGILHNTAWDGAHLGNLPQAVALVAALVTALLGAMWPLRLYGLTCRGAIPRRRGFQFERVREVDWRMHRPLVAATAVAALAGLWTIPGMPHRYQLYVVIQGPRQQLDAGMAEAILALAIPLLGAVVAWLAWCAQPRRLAVTAGGVLQRAADADFGAAHTDAWLAGTVGAGLAHLVAGADEDLLDPVADAVAGAITMAVAAEPRRPGHGLMLAGGLGLAGALAAGFALQVAGHLPGVH